MQMHACTLAHVRAHICTCTRCSVLARTCTLCLRTQTCSAQANAPRLHAPSPFPDPALPPFWLKRWSLPHALTIKAWTLDLVSLSKNNSRCKHHKLTAFTNPLSSPALLLSPPGSNGVKLLQLLFLCLPECVRNPRNLASGRTQSPLELRLHRSSSRHPLPFPLGLPSRLWRHPRYPWPLPADACGPPCWLWRHPRYPSGDPSTPHLPCP